MNEHDFADRLGQMDHRFERIEAAQVETNQRLDELAGGQRDLNKAVLALIEGQHESNRRLEHMTRHLGDRIDQTNERLDRVIMRIDYLAQAVISGQTLWTDRFSALEQRVAVLEQRLPSP